MAVIQGGPAPSKWRMDHIVEKGNSSHRLKRRGNSCLVHVKLIPEHHSYVEPYFGSGAVFFHKEPSDIETINDLDSDVVNLFQCVQENPEKIASLVYSTPFSREVYDKQFSNSKDGQAEADPYKKALGFLIRCWMGHGFRTNGYKFGWKNDVQGREKMYALCNWVRLPEWVIECVERLRHVQIENRPALEVISRFDYSNVFMYIDPPYVMSTRSGSQYKYEMNDKDHAELLDFLVSTKAKVMISGYESQLYNDKLREWTYNDKLREWTKKTYLSQAEHGSPRQEVVWMNYQIKEDYQLKLDI